MRWPATTLLRALALLAALAPAVHAGEAEDVAHAEMLARTHWFHGVPYEAARALRPAGILRLAELLADPSESAHHASAVTALGMSEHPLAFEPLRRLLRARPRGELDRAAYRARIALPYALGHLARGDRRALELLEELAAGEHAPSWSFGRLRGERLRAQLERSAIAALGTTGLPGVIEALEARRAAAGRDEDPRTRRHLDAARRLCERVAREGAARVFRTPRGR